MNPNVLFDKGNVKKETKRLEDYPIIKCSPGEKILCVQRKHPIILIAPMGLPIIISFFAVLSLVFLPQFLRQTFPFLTLLPILHVYIALAIVAVLLLVETFIFMDWYYQFYVITDKVLLYRHYFKIVGFFSEEVFFDKMHQREIRRDSNNIIYDFLKIQDVHVYFNKLEQEEPFIFKTPDNAQVIEDLLENLTIQSGTKN